jgi:hypothetical protein
VDEDGLFNSYKRKHLPLSTRLRVYIDHLLNRLNAMELDQVAKLTRDDVAQIVNELRCKPIILGDPVASWAGSGMPDGYYAAVPILEGDDYVHSWPDGIEGLEPIDVGDPEAANQWSFGYVPGPTGVGIITIIRLSEDEERRELEEPSLQERLAERVVTARRYVDAIAEQMERFFDEDLVERGMALVSKRERNLSITANLGFSPAWKVAAPHVITELETPNEVDSHREELAGPPSISTSAVEEFAADRAVPYRQRLDPASFEDVQRVTRIWADSIERYPAAFTNLHEDRISDLLAATLNATLPGAQREVYTRGGKSDIFIQADVLAAGTGPAKVFICESKWSRSRAVVSEAIDPQLFGYLTAHDTSAVLLLLFRQKGFDTARTSAYDALRAVKGHLCEQSSAVDGWPIFVFAHEERSVRVCIACVHVPAAGETVEGTYFD